MDLRNYPHDVQICKMIFMSYQRAVEEMKLNAHVQIWDDALQSSAFHLVNISCAETSINVLGFNFSRAEVMIKLQRELTTYLYQVFISNKEITVHLIGSL